MTSRWIETVAISGMVLALVVGIAPFAAADPIMLSVVSGPAMQQQENSPCIIGDSSCHNASVAYTLMPPTTAGTVSSPVYTVQQIRNLIGGNVFYVGVDLNQALNHNNGAYTIDRFTLAVDGVTRYSTSQAITLFPRNLGNGYSDATIMRFDLTGLAGTQTLQFTTAFNGATAGYEQYFLHAAAANQTPAAQNPEPATMILLGSGLAGLVAYRRHRRRSSP